MMANLRLACRGVKVPGSLDEPLGGFEELGGGICAPCERMLQLHNCRECLIAGRYKEF